MSAVLGKKEKLIVVSGFINELINQRTTVATKRRKKNKKTEKQKTEKGTVEGPIRKKEFPRRQLQAEKG